jgi:histidinol-phosphate/aromatic aminotransferase/cobyric acid decarboxylase-like protein
MALSLFDSEERQHSPSVFQVAQAAGRRKVADFCYLSNKFFPTAEILSRLGEDLEDIVRNYPSMQTEQTELVATLTGYEPKEILVGNGASELIHLVTARLGRRWMMPYPSYMEYENVIRDFDKDLQLLPLYERDNFAVDPARILEETERLKVDALILPNPNSPTGQRMSREGLLEILSKANWLKTVVVDESFIEFTAINRDEIPTLQAYLEQFPQLIIMRSLGKDFGACGLRLGLMATADQFVLKEIRRFLPIWNINPLAEKFLRLCVQYRADYEKARITCIQETQSLQDGLTKITSLKVFPTYSNFILFKILTHRVNSIQLRDYLLKELGYYVRDCSRKAGLGEKFVRVGTNLPKENATLVHAIAGYLGISP